MSEEKQDNFLLRIGKTLLGIANPLTAKETIEEIGDSIPQMPGPTDVMDGVGDLIVGNFRYKDISGHAKRRDKYGEPLSGNPIEEFANFGHGGLFKEQIWDRAVKFVTEFGKKDNGQAEVDATDTSLGGNIALPNNQKQNSRAK